MGGAVPADGAENKALSNFPRKAQEKQAVQERSIGCFQLQFQILARSGLAAFSLLKTHTGREGSR